MIAAVLLLTSLVFPSPLALFVRSVQAQTDKEALLGLLLQIRLSR
jgi:hypothetical protein